MTQNQYMSVRDVVADPNFPFTYGQVRHFLANREKNGLASATRKINKRIYVRRDLLEKWIETAGQ
jgi:hypothetical protein